MEIADYDSSIAAWAEHTFGRAELNDKRIRRRLVAMTAAIARSPAGSVTRVFTTNADREAAYRFVENKHVDPQAISRAARMAVVERCANEPFVFVAIDGSSVKLADHFGMKDYGSIGTRKVGARGLKVTAGLAISSDGVPIGLTSFEMWPRGKKSTVHRDKRLLAEKETRYVAQADIAMANAFAEQQSSCRPWMLVDREQDATQLLVAFSSIEQWYTVRAKANRLIKTNGRQPQRVSDALAQESAYQGTYQLSIPAGHKRTARKATMSVRAAQVTLMLRDKLTARVREFDVHVVQVRESSRVPAGEKRVEWLLYTNYPVKSDEDLSLVIFGYAQRWRIEDFFRAWKTTGCNVEATQLHSTHSVQIWGTMLAVVAARIERLKHFARNEPYRPATIEFSKDEIEAIVLLKSERKTKTEKITDGIPTIEEAVRWVAEFGGYTGKSSGGPPGSVTIRRGLEILWHYVEAFKIAKKQAIRKM